MAWPPSISPETHAPAPARIWPHGELLRSFLPTPPATRILMSTRASIVCLSAIAILSGCAGARATTSPSPAGSPAVTRAGLTRMIDSMVSAPEFRTALWGVLIVDPEAHDTLYAHNAAKLFIPASNQKLVSSSVMLEQLGPEFRFRTTLAAHGAITNGTLNGDLAVIGRGDPT